LRLNCKPVMRTTDLPLPIVLILAVSIAVVSWLAWRFYHQVPPRRAFVASRDSDIGAWEANISSGNLTLAQAVLEEVCDAFLFKPTDAWRLRPDDKLRSIYGAAYPSKLGLPDAMEYEILFDALHRKFSVTKRQLRNLWASEPTLGDLVAICVGVAERSNTSE